MNPYIIKAPVITEKSLYLANKNNVYTFLVFRTANKAEIKAAVEEIYKVSVESINTVTQARFFKRTGKKRINKWMPRAKKALVKLKEGDTIDLFDLGGEK